MKHKTGMATLMAIALVPFGLGATSAVTAPGDGVSASVIAQKKDDDRYAEKAKHVKEAKEKKIDQADRDAAAARALQQGP